MARRGVGWALPFLAILLGGCLDGGSSPQSTDASQPAGTSEYNGASDSDDPPNMAKGPVWDKGDWWTYEVHHAAEDKTYTTTLVAIEAVPGSWRVAGTDREANLLAEFNHYPPMGDVQRTDLHGKIHGVEIPFFQWPLEDGKTWSDPYRGIDATWTVKAAKQSTGNGTLEGFELTMVAADGQNIAYGYSGDVQWFTHLEFGFGSPPAVTMRLLKWGHGFSGVVPALAFKEYVHRSFDVLQGDPASPSAPTQVPVVQFMPDGGESLGWSVFYGGAVGSYGFGIEPMTPPFSGGVQQGYVMVGPDNEVHWAEILDPLAGPWAAGTSGVSQGPAGLFMEVLGVKDEPVTL